MSFLRTFIKSNVSSYFQIIRNYSKPVAAGNYKTHFINKT